MSEPIFLPELSGLSEPERQFVLDAREGQVCDLCGQTISAKVVIDLLRQARTGWMIGSGRLRLVNASIFGTLSLTGMLVEDYLIFEHVTIRPQGDGPAIDLTDAQIGTITMRSCRLLGAIHADGVAIDHDLVLSDAEVAGGISMDAGRIGGGLCLARSRLTGGNVSTTARQGEPAIVFSGRGLKVRSGVLIDDLKADGAVSLREAVIGASIFAQRLQITMALSAFDLSHCRIGGNLDLTGAQLAGGLQAGEVDICGGLRADGLLTSSDEGVVNLSGARVGGLLAVADAQVSQRIDLSGGEVARDVRIERCVFGGGGRSLDLKGGHFAGHVLVSRSKCAGEIKLDDAVFERTLRIVASRIYGGRNAITASGLSVAQDFDLSQSYVFGAMRLGDCRIGRSLILSGAALKVDEDEAFEAVFATIDRDVRFDSGFQSTGGIVLDRARVSGRLTFDQARIVSSALSRGGRPSRMALNSVIGPDGPDAAGPAGPSSDAADIIAISLVETKTASLLLPQRAGDRPRGVVDLSGARTRRFVDEEAIWPPQRDKRGRSADGADIDHWRLDGFTYETLVHPDGIAPKDAAARRRAQGTSAGDQRLKWLDGQHEDDLGRAFKPQPWRQLQAVFEAAGLIRDGEEIAIAREAVAQVSPAVAIHERVLSTLSGVLTGHGYRPWRTFGLFVGGLVLTVLVFVLAAGQCGRVGCEDQSVFLKTNRDGYEQRLVEQAYPQFDPVLYALDTMVPLVSLDMADHWKPNPLWWPMWRVSIGEAQQTKVVADMPQSQTAVPSRTERRGYLFEVTGGRLLSVFAAVMQVFGLFAGLLMLLAFSGFLRRP